MKQKASEATSGMAARLKTGIRRCTVFSLIDLFFLLRCLAGGEPPSKSTLVVRRLESRIRAGRCAFARELSATKPGIGRACDRRPLAAAKANREREGELSVPVRDRQAPQLSGVRAMQLS